MGHRYCVLGAGRQGTSAAYDLGKYGDPDDLVLADVDLPRAQATADRVNRLFPEPLARPAEADAASEAALELLLRDADLALSALPYMYNRIAAQVAVRTGTSFVDLGGNTDIVRQELSLADEARDAGVALVPDCGMGPGMNVTLLVYALGLVETPRDAFVYDGGLPRDPTPPWNYVLTFSIHGLTNEYTGEAPFLREGRLVRVPSLSEPETVEIPGLGPLEARVTTGGLSTAPWSLEGTLRTLENKTVRYPGHWDQIQAFRDLGLLDVEPIEVDGQPVIPRHLFHALFEPQVTGGPIEDLALIRVRVVGAGGEGALVDLLDAFDGATGFTAMERVTGWHASIVAQMILAGEVEAGAHPVDAVPAGRVVEEAARRGLEVTTTRVPPR